MRPESGLSSQLYLMLFQSRDTFFSLLGSSVYINEFTELIPHTRFFCFLFSFFLSHHKHARITGHESRSDANSRKEHQNQQQTPHTMLHELQPNSSAVKTRNDGTRNRASVGGRTRHVPRRSNARKSTRLAALLVSASLCAHVTKD